MRKIAVIFPGVGYTKDRPLLYYAGKQAQKSGYELVHVDFSGIEWSKEKLKDHDFLRQVTQRCLKIKKYRNGRSDRLCKEEVREGKAVLFLAA